MFGSINMDLMVHTPRLPQPGETVMGQRFETIPGGKGANQAVAAAQQDVPVEMVGRVGNDAFGQTLCAGLKAYGVGCDRLLVDANATSGVALIEVDVAGENHIVVVPGANGKVAADDLQALRSALKTARILLIQLEIPLETAIAAIHMADEMGVSVILDPAPAKSLPRDVYPCVDVLTPNQTEAEQLTGLSITSVETAIAAGRMFQEWGVTTVLITMGHQGVVMVTETHVRHWPVFSVQVTSTVAAGDAFNGGLAAALYQEHPLEDAVVRGMATAALSVMQPGAQASMPNSQTLRAFLS